MNAILAGVGIVAYAAAAGACWTLLRAAALGERTARRLRAVRRAQKRRQTERVLEGTIARNARLRAVHAPPRMPRDGR